MQMLRFVRWIKFEAHNALESEARGRKDFEA